MSTTITPAQAIDALWRVGDLSYLLLDHQGPVRERICSTRARRYVLNISRRWGKSNLLCTLAVEQCLQKPGSSVRYAAGTSDMVEEIIEPHMAAILEDAPDDLAPQFHATKFRWTFPNGSTIRVAGCDDRKKANRLRGRATDLAIIDEAGFIDDLGYVIDDVLMPSLLTTDGQMVISSTPPETPAHPFVGICADAELRGAYSIHTIYDASHIDAAIREEFRKEANGPLWQPGMPDGTTWRREYLCEFVVDTARAVFPEFSERCIEARERPRYFVPVIVGDAGFHDQTFIIGGYHDFENAVDVIEWEYVTSKALARDISAGVMEKATEAWGAKLAAEALKHIDAPPQTVAELGASGSWWRGIAKTETDGPFMNAAVNGVRTRMAGAKPAIRIAPTCTRLIAHVRYGVWRKPGVDFERMEGFGHFDGCAALAYFDRVVNRRTNPFPRIPDGYSSDTHIIPDEWLGEESGRENLRTLARRGSGKR